MAARFLQNWLTQNRTENNATFGPTVSPSLQVGGNKEPKNPNEIVFENNQFKLVVKIDSIRQNRRFKLIDKQFNILVVTKDQTSKPTLIEILPFLEDGFNFILKKIKTFINPDEHRIAYLTIFQQPMINALNSGPFDLHEGSAASDMVSHILNMLMTYLNSNEELKLNETFKVYLTIFSIAHENFQRVQGKKNKKRTRQFYQNKKIHVGCTDTFLFKKNWAIDCPISYPKAKQPNPFMNRCLLLCTVFGLLQHGYYENKIENKAYLYASQINSTNERKQCHAANILLKEISILINDCILPSEGPYELLSTTALISKAKKCQFIIFSGYAHKKKLEYMYPQHYDDSLKPIYIFRPFDSDHLIFIKNINVYFRSNYRICLVCQKAFASPSYRHLCLKREMCFNCRRFLLLPTTYYNPVIIENFCNREVTNEQPFHCSKCNLKIASKHCFKGHKKLCYGKGHFGWKCNSCNRFFYRYNNQTSDDIKNSHNCQTPRKCRYCREPCHADHLCPLKKPRYPDEVPRLAFLNVEFLDNDNSDGNKEPIVASVLIEDVFKRGNFAKYLYSIVSSRVTEECFFNYMPESSCLQVNVKKKKLKGDFKENLEKLYSRQDSSLTTNLLRLIFAQQNTTFLCQDENSTILMFLLNSFVSAGFCPNVIRAGRKFKLISIDQLNINIIPSSNYLPGDELLLAELFNIKYEPYFFPFSYVNERNFSDCDQIPPIAYFYSHFDSEAVRDQKDKFYQQRRNYKWNLLKELDTYCDFKITLLALSFLAFLKESMLLQLELQKKLGRSIYSYLLPFGKSLISLSGFIYTLFRLLYLNNFDIRIVKFEYGYPARKVSQQEYIWSSYWCYKNPSEECLTAFNNPHGQKSFGTTVPDLYIPSKKHCLYYNGCFIHKHYDNCSINSTATENTIAPNGKTYKLINEEFWNKVNNLLINHPDEVDQVTVTWECCFNKIKDTEEFKAFERHHLKKHPLVRLTSRNCFRGAYFDVCAHRWSDASFPDEKLYFVDIVGLYSYVAMMNPFMTGPYKVIIGKELEKLKIENDLFYFEGKKISGGILVTILPPSDLLHPFLLYKTKLGRTVLTLCRTCSENNVLKCNHNESQRSLTGCYLISELEFAIKLRYKVLEVFECHAYFKEEFLFRSFVQALNYFKLINSMSQQLATPKICEYLNENLSSTDFRFSQADFQENLSKRNFLKLCCNSLFGKIAQKSDYNKTLYVSSQEELEDMYFSTNQLLDITCLNDSICQVLIKPLMKNIVPNRNANCYIGAQVTAYARAEIYKHMINVKRNPNSTIYYVDTDCIIFSLPRNDPCPVPISPKCGDFKLEYKDISSFLTLGIKSYVLSYLENSVPKQICKIKGLKLSYNTSINEDLFDRYLAAFLKDQYLHTKIKQPKYFADFKKLKTYFQEQYVTFSNQIFVQRILYNDKRVTSVPYGYKPS